METRLDIKDMIKKSKELDLDEKYILLRFIKDPHAQLLTISREISMNFLRIRQIRDSLVARGWAERINNRNGPDGLRVKIPEGGDQ